MIAFDLQVLMDFECLFYPNNAARRDLCDRPLSEFRRRGALEKLFVDSKYPKYPKYPSYPTHEQAEVMVNGIIPSCYIRELFFCDLLYYNYYQQHYPNLKMCLRGEEDVFASRAHLLKNLSTRF